MDLINVVLLMLGAIVASSMIARAAPVPVPVPFVQIASGVLIAGAVDVDLPLDQEVFLLLFAAPLLFLDGWRLPKEGLLRDRWTIGAPAFGLVFFTVVCAGDDGLAASGVLAAVSAGIAMHHEERSGRAFAITRRRRAAVWDAAHDENRRRRGCFGAHGE